MQYKKKYIIKYMLRPVINRPKCSIEVPGSFLTDEEVIEKASAAANGDKFVSLYNGDISDYPSQSEAELSFMTSLAFWCGGDTVMLKLFWKTVA